MKMTKPVSIVSVDVIFVLLKKRRRKMFISLKYFYVSFWTPLLSGVIQIKLVHCVG